MRESFKFGTITITKQEFHVVKHNFLNKIIFHLPFISVRMEDFLNAAKDKIPTLAGTKFTSSDMFDLGCCLCVDDGRFQMLHGGDEVRFYSRRCTGIEGIPPP